MFAMAGLGVVFVLLGAAMLVLPGPGLLVMVLGAALVAEESLLASRLLDRCDAWVERCIARARSKR